LNFDINFRKVFQKMKFAKGYMFFKQCMKRKIPLYITIKEYLRVKKDLSMNFVISTDWARNEKKDTFYMHDNYIQRCLLLNKGVRELLTDKAVLYKRCPELLGRECLNIDEVSKQDAIEFIKRHERFVGKERRGCSSFNINVYRNSDMLPEDLLELIVSRKQTLLEEYIQQHDEISSIYPGCVNTIRIHTVNNGAEIKTFIKPKLKIGCNGAEINGYNNEGYRAIINDDGSLEMPVYIDLYGFFYKTTEHHNTKTKFSLIRVPYVKESLCLVKMAAEKFPEVPYIGWDVAITPNGPVIVEGNSISGCFTTYQIISYLYNGVGMKTEMNEMLSFAENRKKPSETFLKTAQGLVENSMKILNLPNIYLWGGLGERINFDFIEKKAKEYPKEYTHEVCQELYRCIDKNVIGIDCSGLIKNYLMGGLENFEYQSELDMNTLMLLEKSETSGPIETLPEIPGICLYMKGHVGIYIGNKKVIESTSNRKFGNGVVITNLSDREWIKWFHCPKVIYDSKI